MQGAALQRPGFFEGKRAAFVGGRAAVMALKDVLPLLAGLTQQEGDGSPAAVLAALAALYATYAAQAGLLDDRDSVHALVEHYRNLAQGRVACASVNPFEPSY